MQNHLRKKSYWNIKEAKVIGDIGIMSSINIIGGPERKKKLEWDNLWDSNKASPN